MTQATNEMASPSTALRWFLVPAAVITLFALVGLAVSAEDRSQFEERVASGPGDAEADRPEPGGKFGDGRSPGGSGNPLGEVETGTGTGGGTPDLEVRSPDGEVGIDLSPGTGAPSLGASSDGDGPITLRPDPNGDIAGLRVNENGELEPVPADELRPGDIRVLPADGGVDLVRPDGSTVRLRPGPDGITASEIAADGTSKELTPDANGEIDLGDGISIAIGEPTAQPQPSLWERATDTPWRWIFLGILAVVVASAALAYYLHRRRPDEPFGPDFVGPEGVPVDRFAEFLAMLRADDDPARAIRLAFEAAERGMGRLPARQRTATPFEWYDGVVERHPDLSEPLGGLCNRFATARFAPERPTGADRDAAVANLEQLHLLARAAPRPTDEPGAASEPIGAGQSV